MSTPGGGALAAFRLDDPEAVESADPGGLLRQFASAAAQVRTSWRACTESGLALPRPRPRAIVVAGAGASALAGDMLAAACGTGAAVQVIVVRGHQLPGWVGAADLVAAVSASGSRQETLALAAEAVRRGCDFLAAGPERSPLADIAAQARGSCFVPVSPGPARARLWALTVPLLAAASQAGVLRLSPEHLEAAASALEEVSFQCRPSSESFVNPAKSLALDLVGTLPLIWSGSPLAAAAGRRFASLLAANAKYPALAGIFPEVGYDQIAVLDGALVPGPAPVFPEAETGDFGDLDEEDPGPGLAEPRLVLIADAAGEHPAVTRMREAASSVAAGRGIGVSQLDMTGDDPLPRLARVVQMLDYATAYLAIAGGLDPLSSAARGDLLDLASRGAPEPPGTSGGNAGEPG